MQISVKEKRSELVTERDRLSGEVARHDAAIAALDAFMGAVPVTNGKKAVKAAPVTGKRRGRPVGTTRAAMTERAATATQRPASEEATVRVCR